MWDPQHRYCLVFNGEIYNYHELRLALESRWRFQSHGDTEVLLAGLVLQGASFLAAAEGMWALALWDREQSRLLLARDRMGKKPLYYTSGEDGSLHCASELLALKQLSSVPWEEDIDATADYLRYGFCLPGTTAYKQVLEVLPGHIAEWGPREALHARPYWRLNIVSYRGSQRQAIEELRERFRSAVACRLVADVEVGAFLSGGVDSSLITSFAVELSSAAVKTFAIGFADPAFDERPHARAVAADLGTEHHEGCLKTLRPESLQEMILENVGQPFADPSLLPMAMLARLAAANVKVALSGDGGDELFSGYQRYQARAMMRWYTRLPSPARAQLERGIVALPEPLTHHSHSLIKKAHLFVEAARHQGNVGPYVAPRRLSDEQLVLVAPDLLERGHPAPSLPTESTLDSVQEMSVRDALVYLPQDILQKVDRATMAYSLEARAPFLDSGLVAFSLSLPRHWHRRGLRGKRLLREAFGGRLDSRIWKRRKQGFSVPVGAWFRGPLGDELLRLSLASPGPLRLQGVEQLLSLHRSGARDLGLVLWALYVYLLWRINQTGA
jgi:asparagine synthase (glutamine-hydrolysing)